MSSLIAVLGLATCLVVLGAGLVLWQLRTHQRSVKEMAAVADAATDEGHKPETRAIPVPTDSAGSVDEWYITRGLRKVIGSGATDIDAAPHDHA